MSILSLVSDDILIDLGIALGNTRPMMALGIQSPVVLPLWLEPLAV